ncbi:hypothetical protein [Geopsychrobacter electrodiphilus]|uniref:hypothetical protein n=1 Tax=Geopsychrobacter electrodiphilus TaxID=225196 RepID=UPI0003794F1A|nr:hypothetical protein [Geopsychrobacter electrodiphilus]
MRVPAKGHIFETLPPFMNNRVAPESDQVVIGLKVATSPEQDALNRERQMAVSTYAIDKAQLEMDRLLKKFINDHFGYCRGLVIEGVNDDGRDLTFDELYEQGPPEISDWVSKAILSTGELTRAERKNYLPG